jgi:hypothetical protein
VKTEHDISGDDLAANALDEAALADVVGGAYKHLNVRRLGNAFTSPTIDTYRGAYERNGGAVGATAHGVAGAAVYGTMALPVTVPLGVYRAGQDVYRQFRGQPQWRWNES